MPLRASSRLAVCGWLTAALAGQTPTHAPERLRDGEVIRVDARLDEPIWQRARPIGDLTQVVPIDGAPPTVRTEVLVAFDQDAIYVALRCFDDPAVVRANLMARDARLDPDDRVEMWFDTFDDNRFAYWFQIGAGGSEGDALLSDGGRDFNKSWDGIWAGRARVTDRGWQAECRFPFQTLAFDQADSTWGFNVRRLRKANDEEARWASPSVAYSFFSLPQGGTLIGLTDLRQGLGVDVVPYATATGRRRQDGMSGWDTDFNVGGDVNYRITPSLNLRATYDTDFAETEVDSLQLNLTRFPLFFPERRDFFLEDAGKFVFGAPNRRRDTIPFFSRRIGLGPDGGTVPILGGVRLTGRAGDWNLGLLQTVIDERDASGSTPRQPEEGLGVVRVSRNLGEESSVGMIYTGGDPSGRGYSSTQGVDVRLADSQAFGPGQGLFAWAYFMDTHETGGPGDGQAWGLQVDYRGRDWEHSVDFNSVDDDFDPKLGFVQRRGIRRYRSNSTYTWRSDTGGVVRRVDWRLSPTYIDSDGGREDFWAVPWRWGRVTFDTEDSVEIETHRIFERVPEEFSLGGGAVVAPGDYTMTRHFVTLRASERRSLNGSVRLEAGDFYGGDLLRLTYGLTWIPSRFVQLAGEYQTAAIDLPSGSVTRRLAEGRVDIQLNPRTSISNLVQYSQLGGQLSAQSRLRWIVSPGNELFVVGLFGWNDPGADRGLGPQTQDLAMKFVYTLRF